MNQPAAHATASMSVEHAIAQRCSIRAFEPGKVAWASITTLLSAAVRAPTAMHAEPWAFAVIQDRALLGRISEHARRVLAEEPHPELLHRAGHALDVFTQHGFDVFHGAGTLIVIGSQSQGRFVDADCWLAAENLMLQAVAAGLGTCVIGSAVGALNLSEVKAEIGVPEDFRAIAPIVVGVPAAVTPASARADPRLLAWV